jgi:hypothetical protein
VNRTCSIVLATAGLATAVILTAPVVDAATPVPAARVVATAPARADLAKPPLASSVLAKLAVKGRAPKTGYARSKYGAEWADLDHDGCWTREEVLQRDLIKKTYKKSGRCTVIATGILQDPYSGKTMTFKRGSATSSLVQIDHVVALMDSWQKGAQQFTPAQRLAFANDPLNLLAVNGTLNQQKGASDAASWLPPNKAYRCAYVARQVAVKAKYRLWVTAAEKDAIARILTTCPGQQVPTR